MGRVNVPLTSSTDTTKVLFDASTEKLLLTLTAIEEPRVIAGNEEIPRTASLSALTVNLESLALVASKPMNLANSDCVAPPTVKSISISEASPVVPELIEKVSWAPS